MDVELVNELYRRHGAKLLRRTTAILGDRDGGRDAMHEVFVIALTTGMSFTSAGSELGWLRRVATNLCLNSVRDARRRNQLLCMAAGSAARDHASSSEAGQTLRGLLREVPPELQEIAICYFVHEMTQAEIAASLGIPRRTIAYRLERFRAIARARALQHPPRRSRSHHSG